MALDHHGYVTVERLFTAILIVLSSYHFEGVLSFYHVIILLSFHRVIIVYSFYHVEVVSLVLACFLKQMIRSGA